MSSLKALNQAMDYLEEHLCEEIDWQKLGKIAGCSGGLFPRIFSLLVGIPLSEYIRLRRLSNAAMELQNGHEKIIDIALRYGYESVDAFSAAFKKYHGKTPSLVRKGASFQLFSPICFSFSIRGGVKMNMRFEKKEAFQVAGLVVHSGKNSDFSGVWQELLRKVPMDQLIRMGSGESYGLCYDFINQENFSYMAAFDLQEESFAQERGLTILQVPQAEYAVFEIVGAIPQSIHEGWEYIIGTFFTESEYEHAGTPDFEYYLEGDMSAPDYKMELWVPIRKK